MKRGECLGIYFLPCPSSDYCSLPCQVLCRVWCLDKVTCSAAHYHNRAVNTFLSTHRRLDSNRSSHYKLSLLRVSVQTRFFRIVWLLLLQLSSCQDSSRQKQIKETACRKNPNAIFGCRSIQQNSHCSSVWVLNQCDVYEIKTLYSFWQLCSVLCSALGWIRSEHMIFALCALL